MKWRDVISEKDLGEPYASMYFLNIAEIRRIEKHFKGTHIPFKKYVGNVKKAYPELCRILGEEKTKKMIETFLGEDIYIPKIKRTCLRRIRELISEQFDGSNYVELARRYEYSERHIRRIVGKTASQNRPCENQISFFDEL